MRHERCQLSMAHLGLLQCVAGRWTRPSRQSLIERCRATLVSQKKNEQELLRQCNEIESWLAEQLYKTQFFGWQKYPSAPVAQCARAAAAAGMSVHRTHCKRRYGSQLATYDVGVMLACHPHLNITSEIIVVTMIYNTESLF